MKKNVFLASAVVMVMALAGSVAASETGNLVPMGVGTKQQAEVKNQNEEKEIEMENEERVQSGSGSGTQLRLEDRERLRDDTGTGTPEQEDQDDKGMENAEQRRSQVANAVQAMLQVADRNGGLGEQVRVIAQAQNQNQEQLETSLEKVKERGGFAKFFIGPNYGEIKNAQQMLEQNREKIQELNQIAEKLANTPDRLQLMEQIKTLEQAQLQIQNMLATSQKGFSLFGWAFRLFSR